jgi:hypothetical protein
MKKLLIGFAAAATLAGGLAIGSVAPANAETVFVPMDQPAQLPVTNAAWDGYYGPYGGPRYYHWRHHHRWAMRHAWRDHYYGGPYYRRHSYGYYDPYYYGYHRYHRWHRGGVGLYLSF